MGSTASQIDAKANAGTGATGNIQEGEFLSADGLVTVKREAAERCLRLTIGEIELLSRENKWQDVLAAFFPVAEKLPELVDSGMDGRVREKLAFALGQLGRFDEAIAELEVCVRLQPDNFHAHSSLAYTAYNSLYAAKNREVLLSGHVRAERVKIAHRHFQAAQALRPEGVTCF
jgi:tetratricopeptide (TPR) repeat protein